jgi:hypothetical protein
LHVVFGIPGCTPQRPRDPSHFRAGKEAARAFLYSPGFCTSSIETNDRARPSSDRLFLRRALKGEKPGDLRVLQASRFELVFNLRTAKMLGITVLSGMMAVADDGVEEKLDRRRCPSSPTSAVLSGPHGVRSVAAQRARS